MKTPANRGSKWGRNLLYLAIPWSCACSNGDEHVDLTMFTWWTRPSEIDAFTALQRIHETRHPEVSVSREKPGSDQDQSKDELWRRMFSDPPATFHATAGAASLRWAFADTAEGMSEDGLNPISTRCLVANLSPLFQRHDLTNVLPQELQNALCMDPVGSGVKCEQFVAVPINIHRLNVIYYNTESLNRFKAAAAADDRSPLDVLCSSDVPFHIALDTSASSTGFSYLVFENLIPAFAGAAFYEKLFSGEGELDSDWKEKIRPALQCALRLANHRTTTALNNWWDGLEQVRSGIADLTVMGDWANAEVTESIRDGTVTPAPFPGTEDLFVFTSDSFPLPLKAEHRDKAEELLDTMASTEAQIAFSEKKGSIPARRDAAILAGNDAYLGVLAATQQAFMNSTRVLATSGLLPYYYPNASVQTALANLAEANAGDAEIDAVIEELENARYTSEVWHSRREQGVVRGACDE